MKSLSISLKNCHGIRELSKTFQFDKGNAVAIYAPNGTMKTSFARTFVDLSQGDETKDRMFPDRETSRSVSNEDDKELTSEDVAVFLSYDEELGPTEATSTLLVNSALRQEYESLQQDLSRARDELAAALKEQARTKQKVDEIVSRVFTQQDNSFFTALVRLSHEIEEEEAGDFADVPYDKVFNNRVQEVLRKPELQSVLADYVARLNELLDESTFFSRQSFTFYNAANITKSLGENGFFAAKHSIHLHGEDGGQMEISSTEDLDALISREKHRITEDEGLRQKLGAVEKALNKNQDTRAFLEYISSRIDLLPELTNVDLLEQKLWKSYLKAHKDLYENAVRCFKDSENRKKEIERQAAAESTQWERVIDIFNKRFFVPFHLNAVNREKVVLGQEDVLQLEFQFAEGRESTPVEREELLAVLSAGEKKALYILNVLFAVETRKASGFESLFVIDDIADSFDYKNKYAIIQYLKEMSEQQEFRLILLTHNFDFFRTLESRGVVGYNRCYVAHKAEDKILLSGATGVKNPFIKDFKKEFFIDGMKRVACIPFTRNILEYTKGEGDTDYLTLTSLLHWNNDTPVITQEHLDSIFTRAFGPDDSWHSPSEYVQDLAMEQADLALSQTKA